MLYLEDYLEIIENLPQELCERFTNMRELDLQVHNNKDKLDAQLKEFFNIAQDLNPENRDAQFTQMKQEYLKNLDHAQDKINLSNQIYEMVDKYYRRLENDLHKFKLELEADNPGITEIIEKRAMESENMLQRNKRKTTSQLHHILQNENLPDLNNENFVSNQLSLARHKQLSAALANFDAANLSLLNNPEKLPGAVLLKAAASQAALNAQQLTQNRRYSSCLKSTYDSANSGASLSHLYNFGSFSLEQQDSFNNIMFKNSNTQNNGEKFYVKRPRMNNKRSRNSSKYMDASSSNSNATSFDEENNDEPTADAEATYCICNNISWGQMIFCEGISCPYNSWFHYDCVGIKEPPEGDWFCPSCVDKMNRKR